MNITDGNTSYLIKLDNIDVNYISNRNFEYNGASCPLWSANNAKNRGTDEYVEFTIMAEKKNDYTNKPTKSYGGNIGYPTYKCKICDLHIPIAYRNQHNGSVKHKTYAKIAEAVLQRTQGHLLVEDEHEIVQYSPETYFCEPCTIIVKKSEDLKHEASESHRKSVLHDRHLNDLLNVYLDKDYLVTADVQNAESSQSHNSVEDIPSNFNDDNCNDVTTNNFPIYSFNNKGFDTKENVLNNIAIHSENFDKGKKGGKKKKSPKPAIIPIKHTLAHSSVFSSKKWQKIDMEITKNANKPVKSKTDANKPVVDVKKLTGASLIATGYSMFQLNRYSVLGTANINPFDCRSPALKDYINMCKERFNSNGYTSDLFNGHNQSIKKSMVGGRRQSTDDQNCSIEDVNSNALVDNQQSIDEQYHSTDDSYNTVDGQQMSIDEQTDLTEDQGLKKTDEKLINNRNRPIANQKNQNNGTSKQNNTVSVNSSKLNVDRKQNKETVLSESQFKSFIDIITNVKYEMRPIHKLKYINKDYIEIETLDKCTVTVKSDNFNGFCPRDGRLQCRVCMVMVDEDPAEHVYKIDHIANVRVALEDVHCLRKISDSFKHCLHCNDTVCNVDIHILLEKHLVVLNENICRSITSTTSTTSTTRTPIEPKKVGRTYCEACNIYIDTHNFDSHRNGRSHKYNLSLFSTKETKKTDTTNTDTIYCEKCKKYVITANFDAHSERHVKPDSGELKKNNDADTIYCEPCHFMISNDDFASHLYGKTHKASLKLANECEGSQKDFCGTCNFYVEELCRHLIGKYHEYFANKTNAAMRNNAQGPTSSISRPEDANHHVKSTNLTEAMCLVCDVKVPNKEENIKEHIIGRAHKMTFNTLLDKNTMKIVDNKFLCGACKITVELSQDLEHIEMNTHKFAIMQLEASETQPNPKSQYHCEPCDEDIVNTPSAIQEHKASMGHKISSAFYKVINHTIHYHYERIPNSIDTVLCRICDIHIQVEHAKKHIESPMHNYKYRTTLNDNKVQKRNKKYFCQMCSVDIQDKEDLKHIRSEAHVLKMRETSTNSQMTSTPKNTGYHCSVCRVDVPNNTKSIVMHENGGSHLRKLKNLSPDDEEEVLMTRTANGKQMVCSVCKVMVSLSGTAEHVRGARHKYNKNIATASVPR